MSDSSARPSSAAPGFADLIADARLLRALEDVGYESPSPVQARTIPLLLAGRDVVGLAQTGTGKTAAFALPILSAIDPARSTPQALVLAPTRELALQVAEAFTAYAKYLPQVRVLPIYGGAGYAAQLSGLRRGAHIVVGTPGRVIDHLERGTLDLSGIDHLVLDEADEMLRMGFAEDVERILADTPKFRQVALFSATMPAQIRGITRKHLNQPAEVKIKSETMTVANTRQRWMLVPHHGKLDALTRVLEVESGAAMIIFVRTKQGTEELSGRLRARGFAAQAISGDLAQNQRERVIAQLKDGSLDILVATDVAARGLDVERISHVINYDIPHDTEAYVHRIGRTGRAGRTGEAILFVTPRERRLLGAIEKVTRAKITEAPIPTAADVNARRKERFAEEVTAALAGPQLPQFRELVSGYLDQSQADPVDVAAALAALAHAGDELWMAPDQPQRRFPASDRDPAPRSRKPRQPGKPRAKSRSENRAQPRTKKKPTK